MEKQRVVIVGGGFAGLAVARGLRKAPVEITLVDRTNHHLFQPLLYQVAMGGLNPAEIASPLRGVLRGQKNLTCWMGEVTALDPQARRLELDQGKQSLEYDLLVLAAGGCTSYFGNDHWEKFAPGLKTLQEALEIRHRVLTALEGAERAPDSRQRERLMTMVVIGGGPTGVEMAGGLAELTRSVLRWDYRQIQPHQARVILLEGGPRLLTAFPERLSEYTRKRLERMGVEVRLGERVLDLQAGKVITDKAELEAENIIWAAGVGGNPIAAMLGAETDRAGRILVESDLRVKGQEHIYCLGDMASYCHPHTFEGKPLPGVAPVAMQQGRWAARNILAQLKGQSTRPFEYFDKGTMATIGRTAAVAISGPLKFTGLSAWFAWLFIHVIYLVDFQNQILVILRWIWAYFTWKWNARLITQVPPLQFCPHEPPTPGVSEPEEPAQRETESLSSDEADVSSESG